MYKSTDVDEFGEKMTVGKAPAQVRTRNAAATRAGILEAARRRFTEEGYDGASLRDIAAEAGVDVALVARYFGSKEELFREVLTQDAPEDLFRGDPSEVGLRLARMLVIEPRNDGKLDKLLMILRSTSAPKAAEVIRSNIQETFYGPLEGLIGGPDRLVRARLVAAVITGFAITRAIDENYLLTAQAGPELCERMAALLSGLLDGTGDASPR